MIAQKKILKLFLIFVLIFHKQTYSTSFFSSLHSQHLGYIFSACAGVIITAVLSIFFVKKEIIKEKEKLIQEMNNKVETIKREKKRVRWLLRENEVIRKNNEFLLESIKKQEDAIKRRETIIEQRENKCSQFFLTAVSASYWKQKHDDLYSKMKKVSETKSALEWKQAS